MVVRRLASLIRSLRELWLPAPSRSDIIVRDFDPDDELQELLQSHLALECGDCAKHPDLDEVWNAVREANISASAEPQFFAVQAAQWARRNGWMIADHWFCCPECSQRRLDYKA